MTQREENQKRILNQIAALERVKKEVGCHDAFHKPYFSLKAKLLTLFSTFRFGMNGIVMKTFRRAIDEAIDELRDELKRLEQ